MGDTIFSSEMADAAVIRIHNTNKAIGVTSDCNPVYYKSDPKRGAEIAVAESWRNLIATGAEPIAITDNLNFGNPEKKEIMYEIKEAIKGIKKACYELNYPVVSGNVSLYNETNGKSIFPTPVIGGVGIIKNINHIKGFNAPDNSYIYIIGKTTGHLGSSLFYEKLKIYGGKPPKIDYSQEKKMVILLNFLSQNTNVLEGCHDISEGGIALAISELCLANKKGIEVKFKKTGLSTEKFLFCEDQSRYLLIINDKKEFENLAKNNIDFERIGIVTGNSLNFVDLFSISISNLVKLNTKWFKDYMT